MTLLIAYVLFAHYDFGFWAYFWTAWLWLCHVAYHHVDLDGLKQVKADLDAMKKTLQRMAVGGGR